MGDDFNMAYHTLIKVAESLGYKDQAGKLREQYQQLKTSPGALADYTFGKEIRYFGSQMMFPAEQVAKEKGMALTDDVLYLDLKGKGHSFSILKDVPNVDGRLQGVPDVLVDGIPMTLDLPPARYKHQRYYLDGGLVDFVFGGLLNPRKMVRPPFLPDFRINSVYLEANLPVEATVEDDVATWKLIDAAVKLDPLLFKRKSEANVQEHAVVISLHCGQNKDSDKEYRFSSKLGNRWTEEFIDFPSAVETMRGRLANLLQVQLARRILNDSPQSKVVVSTSFQCLPNPTKNPALHVNISMPNSSFASTDAYEQCARWLADSVAKLNSEISGSD